MAIIALMLIGVVAIIAIAMVVKNTLYVCQPNEVLIFSGRRRRDDGRDIGYRFIKGGRTIRVPLIETVDRMDLTNMIIEVSVRGAYAKGGIPLSVQGVANLKIPGEAPLIHHAVERFLGKSRSQIMEIAQETLEGNLRGVLATLTPEQVNQDKEAFAGKLAEEAEHDLNRIGLVLDTLKIQNVSDEVGYLDAIGRIRSASVRRNAQVAEAGAQAEAAKVKWDRWQAGELDKITERITTVRSENERRVADARTKREAMIAEQRAAVQAAIAQASAESETQQARIEQVRLKLQADVIKPAEAKVQEDWARAKADAARIVEQGRATAQVLTDLATSYRQSEGTGRDVLLMQKLVPLLDTISGTIGDIHVDRLTVIGKNGQNGDGKALAASLITTSEQIKAATGIDVPGVLRDRFGTGETKSDPPTREAYEQFVAEQSRRPPPPPVEK
jgi:flotillin